MPDRDPASGNGAAEQERPSALKRPAYAYDAAKRRRVRQRQRERGVTVYIPADELERAGYDLNDPPRFYRVWGTSRGGLFVRLYREP